MTGPPGVGKTATAWELYRRLDGVGFVDIDQLGMVAPVTDPYRVKARNLVAVAHGHRRAGAG